MTLSQTIRRLEELGGSTLIFARRPWTPEAECLLVEPDEDLAVPQRVRDAGFEYFLEVEVAREVMEVLRGRRASEGEVIDLLIYYAQNDAYPSWVFAI